MKLQKLHILVAILLSTHITYPSQAISVTFSFISGSTSKTVPTLARYPIGYGTYEASNTCGGRYGNKIIVHGKLIYQFLGLPWPGNDVWAIDTGSRLWSWIAGKSNDGNPVFGNIGQVSRSNTPGYRLWFASDLHPTSDELILFGGQSGSDIWSDLWSFDISAMSWTWIAGPQTSSESARYTSTNIATNPLTPGARYGAGAVIYLTSGELLLYGGYNGAVRLADLWAFNFVSLQWSFKSGTSSTTALASFGQNGQWSPAYFPARRSHSDLTINTSTKIVYLFGGHGGPIYLNDLWAFKYATLEWACLTGDPSGFTNPVYGNMGSQNALNTPGARQGHSIGYHEKSSLIIVISGHGKDFSQNTGRLSDMWMFDIVANEWTWVAGSSTIEVATVFSGANAFPAASFFSSMAVDQQSGSIYLFGGDVYHPSDARLIVDHMWRADISVPVVSSSVRLTTSPSRSPSSRKTSISSSVSSLSTTKFLSSSLTRSIVSSQKSQTSSKLSTDVRPSAFDILSEISETTLKSVDTSYVLESAISEISEKTTAMEHHQTEYSKFGTHFSSAHKATVYPGNYLDSVSPAITYVVLATILVLIILVNVATYKFIRKHSKTSKIGETLEEATETTTSDFSQSTSLDLTSTTITENTWAETDLALYLPLGLQVNSISAYRVDKEIARGGGGTVWLATALEASLRVFGETVIVKVPHTAKLNDRKLAIFRQEIAIVNAFKNHQNIIRLLGFTEEPYSIIYKFYPRGALSKWITGGYRSKRQALDFLHDISRGITVLHNAGIVHCDLKPDNILVDKGPTRAQAVLSDFGVANVVTDKLLRVGAYEVQQIHGISLAYAAPEVILEFRNGVRVTKSTTISLARDLYALGFITLAILNGRGGFGPK